MLISGEHQRTYLGYVFDLWAVINHLCEVTKFYDIERAVNDDVKDACRRSFLMFMLS